MKKTFPERRATLRKSAFTLIEMLISVSILSIMMIFLYKSYASLNKSNEFMKKHLSSLKIQQLKKQIIFLDFSSSLETNIINKDSKADLVFTQTSNSLHRKYNPYVAYIVKESKLYRLESLTAFTEATLNLNNEFSVDNLGEINSFRLYRSKDQKNKSYLVHIDFKYEDDILMKILK